MRDCFIYVSRITYHVSRITYHVLPAGAQGNRAALVGHVGPFGHPVAAKVLGAVQSRVGAVYEVFYGGGVFSEHGETLAHRGRGDGPVVHIVQDGMRGGAAYTVGYEPGLGAGYF